MSSCVQLTEAELLELYRFMEKANELFHQPMNYSDADKIAQFGQENYPTIKKYYYKIFHQLTMIYYRLILALYQIQEE